jgi:hypothetical protein
MSNVPASTEAAPRAVNLSPLMMIAIAILGGWLLVALTAR